MRRIFAISLAAMVTVVAPAIADPPARPSASSTAPPEAVAVARLVAAVNRVGGTVGVAVMDLDTGELLAAHQPNRAMNPASNMKIVTAWAALRLLGPRHRYLTGLYGRIDGERLARLAIWGDGDPSLDHAHLADMAARLHRAGVRHVGEIVVDQSSFDEVFTPPAFAQQPNEWASFRAPVAAVSVARNTVRFEIRPRDEGTHARVSAIPANFVTMSGAIATGAPGTTSSVKLSVSADGAGSQAAGSQAAGLRAEVAGRIPAGARTMEVTRRVADPRLLPGHALAEALERVGIRLDGEVTAGNKRGPLLSAHRSATLPRLLHRLGKNSDNFYAEMIFKSLGRDATSDEPASFARASQRVRAALTEAGIDTRALRLDNGSGLFDANRLTAGATTELLRHAFNDPSVAPELVAQLSIGGTDGTLRARMAKARGSGAVRAKTGTLAAVSALSGYVFGKQRRYVVSILINDARGHAIPLRRDIDRMVEAIL